MHFSALKLLRPLATRVVTCVLSELSEISSYYKLISMLSIRDCEIRTLQSFIICSFTAIRIILPSQVVGIMDCCFGMWRRYLVGLIRDGRVVIYY